MLSEGAMCMGSGHPGLVGHEFSFELAEEAFDGRVVPAIADAAHARDDAVGGQYLLIRDARVLDTAIGMMEQAGRRPSGAQREVQRGERQLRFQVRARGPADDAARGKVEHDFEIQPALERPAGRDVRGPYGIGLGVVKAAAETIADDVHRADAVRSGAKPPSPPWVHAGSGLYAPPMALAPAHTDRYPDPVTARGQDGT